MGLEEGPRHPELPISLQLFLQAISGMCLWDLRLHAQAGITLIPHATVDLPCHWCLYTFSHQWPVLPWGCIGRSSSQQMLCCGRASFASTGQAVPFPPFQEGPFPVPLCVVTMLKEMRRQHCCTFAASLLDACPKRSVSSWNAPNHCGDTFVSVFLALWECGSLIP